MRHLLYIGIKVMSLACPMFISGGRIVVGAFFFHSWGGCKGGLGNAGVSVEECQDVLM